MMITNVCTTHNMRNVQIMASTQKQVFKKAPCFERALISEVHYIQRQKEYFEVENIAPGI